MGQASGRTDEREGSSHFCSQGAWTPVLAGKWAAGVWAAGTGKGHILQLPHPLGAPEGGAAAEGRASPPSLRRPGDRMTSFPSCPSACPSLQQMLLTLNTNPSSPNLGALGAPGARLNIAVLKLEKPRLSPVTLLVPGWPLDLAGPAPEPLRHALSSMSREPRTLRVCRVWPTAAVLPSDSLGGGQEGGGLGFHLALSTCVRRAQPMFHADVHFDLTATL